MISIVCKSKALAAELALLASPDYTIHFSDFESNNPDIELDSWLKNCLSSNDITTVLYEPRYFVDPARYRALSPCTRFIIISAPGEEQVIQTALVCGACAVIDKPLVAHDVRGVLDLVSD